MTESRITFTVGHSTRPAAELVELFGGHGVDLLVEVRRLPAVAAATAALFLAATAGAAGQEMPTADSAAADSVSAAPPYVARELDVTVASRTAGGHAAVSRSVEVLTSDELQRFPARTVGEVLRWAAGVEVRSRSAAQADLSLRGSSFEQVLVLVDGVPMNDAQTAHFDLDLAVPLESVERIEIIRGPASALYGADALGGVVNVVTGSPEGEEGLSRARVEGGAFGQVGAAVSARMSAGSVDLAGAGEYRRSDGHRPGTDSRIAKATVRGEAPAGGGRLLADLGVALRDFGANGFYSSFDSYEETRTLTASARWVPSDRETGLRVEPRVGVRLHDDDFVLVRSEPDGFRNRHTSWQVGGELTLRATPADELAVAWGGELYRDRLDSDNLGRRAENRGAFFGEAAAGRMGRLLATAGLRLDWHEVYGTEVSPTASAAVWPMDGLKLRSSVGRSFRTPSWTERFLDSPANVGTASLDPETSWSGEVGVEATPTRGMRIGVTGFLREARELIDWSRPEGADPGTTPWRTRNVESARYRGVEADADAVLPGGVRLRAGWELLSVEARAARGMLSKRALRPLTEKLRVEVTRELGDLSPSVRWMRADRRGSGEPYHLLEVRMSLRMDGMRWYLEGTNLTDDEYPDITGHPAPGRALVAGLEWGLPTVP